jgi:hypothetical protein
MSSGSFAPPARTPAPAATREPIRASAQRRSGSVGSGAAAVRLSRSRTAARTGAARSRWTASKGRPNGAAAAVHPHGGDDRLGERGQIDVALRPDDHHVAARVHGVQADPGTIMPPLGLRDCPGRGRHVQCGQIAPVNQQRSNRRIT